MSTYGYLVLCIQACLIQNAVGQFLPSFGRKGLGLEVDAEAVSRRVGLGNFGLNNYRLNGGLTNFEESGVARGIGLKKFGAGGISLNNVGARGIDDNNLSARGIGLNNVGTTGIGNNIGVTYSGEFSNAALLGGSKYGVGVGVPNVAAVSGVPVTGPFVSNGGGEIVVGGEFAAAGTTLVAGQLPVLGAVGFSGPIPARGVVSIAGECGCSRIPL